ncbi:MAG TPA: type II secretion system F family protein, partial [Limnochordia bacterium]|nr:type II secretion system F family protein [Limnochordia bacterium]
MALLLSLMVFGVFAALAAYFFGGAKSVDAAVVERVQRFRGRPQDLSLRAVELDVSLMERVIKPMIGRMSTRVLRFTPQQALAKTRAQLVLAGLSRIEAHEFIAIRYVIGLTAAGGGLVLLLPIGPVKAVYFGLVLGLIAVQAPTYWLRQKVTQRKHQLVRALPDVLDLLTVSVEAGLGFDSAVGKVVEKTTGPLGDEFERTLQEIRLGKSRREALRDLGERNGADELRTFTSALVQADQLGVSISNVLRVQSAELRRVRRQTAEEKAMKAP